MKPATSLPAREKWQLFISGHDAGPMVSPLCDDWSLDVSYYWPYENEPEPFPAGHRYHALSQQMAMAKVCGWDPTFLCGADMPPRDPDIRPRNSWTALPGGGTRNETVIQTPLGPLSCITETKSTTHVVKNWIETEEDLRRTTWLTRRQADFDESVAIAQGREARAAIGDKGVMGTWISPPVGNCMNHDMMFYHLADWPDACEELHQATRRLTLRQIETLHRAGFDYLFYCVDGTEWISPDFFRQHIHDDTLEIFARWRAMGGFILWHSCGRIGKFVELGIYNAFKPEIFETMSEPPVGSLPSLRWARERLDPAIATKGNIPLGVLLAGTPDDVRAEVRRIRQQTVGWRHIVGLSDDILKGTPLANARAMVDEAREG